LDRQTAAAAAAAQQQQQQHALGNSFYDKTPRIIHIPAGFDPLVFRRTHDDSARDWSPSSSASNAAAAAAAAAGGLFGSSSDSSSAILCWPWCESLGDGGKRLGSKPQSTCAAPGREAMPSKKARCHDDRSMPHATTTTTSKQERTTTNNT